jgi:hypothetical protein
MLSGTPSRSFCGLGGLGDGAPERSLSCVARQCRMSVSYGCGFDLIRARDGTIQPSGWAELSFASSEPSRLQCMYPRRYCPARCRTSYMPCGYRCGGAIPAARIAVIGVQGRLIEAARLGLDAGLFQGKPVGIQAHLLQQSNIVGPAAPGTSRVAGAWASTPASSARQQSLRTPLPSMWCATVVSPDNNPSAKRIS